MPPVASALNVSARNSANPRRPDPVAPTPPRNHARIKPSFRTKLRNPSFLPRPPRFSSPLLHLLPHLLESPKFRLPAQIHIKMLIRHRQWVIHRPHLLHTPVQSP